MKLEFQPQIEFLKIEGLSEDKLRDFVRELGMDAGWRRNGRGIFTLCFGYLQPEPYECVWDVNEGDVVVKNPSKGLVKVERSEIVYDWYKITDISKEDRP